MDMPIADWEHWPEPLQQNVGALDEVPRYHHVPGPSERALRHELLYLDLDCCLSCVLAEIQSKQTIFNDFTCLDGTYFSVLHDLGVVVVEGGIYH